MTHNTAVALAHDIYNKLRDMNERVDFLRERLTQIQHIHGDIKNDITELHNRIEKLLDNACI